MAVTIAPPPLSMQAGAEQLLSDPARWTSARRKADDKPFFIVAGRTGTYYTTADACTCRGFRERGICSHQVAATMKEAQEAARRTPSELPVFMTFGNRRSR